MIQSDVILLSGFAGSGKDTAARMMAEALGDDVDVRYISFAGVLKAEVAQEYGLDALMLDGGSKESREFREKVLSEGRGAGSTPRQLLQNWGTMRRRDDPNYFVKKVWDYIRSIKSSGCVVVFITDCRYHNEAVLPSLMDMPKVRLHRVRIARDLSLYEGTFSGLHRGSPADSIPDLHDSEWRHACGDFPVDLTVNNHGDLAQFKQACTEAICNMIGSRS